MKIKIKTLDRRDGVEIEFTASDTFLIFEQNIRTALSLNQNQSFDLIHDGNTFSFADCFDALQGEDTDDVQSVCFILKPRQCGLTPTQAHNLKNMVEIFSPVVVGILACIGLSVAAGLMSVTPLALGFMVTAAVIAFLGGIVGSFAVIVHKDRHGDQPMLKLDYSRQPKNETTNGQKNGQH